ncbi:MAG: hypothetical protein J5865_06805 [Lachnospiraceae bacterium]|nr:hypothetical protein [Lachnospiraceae bacterium]
MEKIKHCGALALMLAALLLAGCVGTDTAVQNRDDAMTLWDGEIAMRKEVVPPAAFEPEAKTCAAMAPDGVTLLMVDGTAPYLYELRTHKWVALFPKNESSREAAEELVVKAHAQGGRAEEIEAEKKRVSGLSAEDLTKELVSIGTGEPAGPYALPYGFTSDGNYLLAGTEGQYVMVIDCEDAGYYMIKGGRPVSIRKDYMLAIPEEPGTEVTRVHLQTGEQFSEKFAIPAESDGQDMVCAAAHYLEDGSICALLRGKETSAGQAELCLTVQGTDGSGEAYGLGSVPAAQLPDRLCSVGERYILAGAADGSACFLIDRETEKVSKLFYQDGKIAAAELLEQADGLILWGLLADKQAVLMQEAGGNGALLIYRPDLGETQQFITNTADNCFGAQQAITGNYYGRYVMQPFNSDNTYTQLGIRELQQ